MWYHVSEPNTYLVITGARIDNVSIKKKAFVLPFQKVTKISATPFDFGMTLQAMTKEKLKFSLPAVFTIGPNVDDPQAMLKYATLLTGQSDGAPEGGSNGVVSAGRNHVQDIVRGIIEGETRSIVSNMTIEEVFASRAEYKKQVIEKVQSELDQFGLMIYNANVKELEDTAGSEYFSFMRRKAHESASNQARIDVASAAAKGQIGQAERESHAKQEIAKIDATTAVAETVRKTEKERAEFDLENTRIEIAQNLTLQRLAAERAAETRDAELKKTLELKRADMELERRRATDVVKAKISRESAEQAAEADKFTAQTRADGNRYAEQALAEAHYARQSKQTDAETYDQRQRALAARDAAALEAEARLLKVRAEAQGMLELAGAYQEMSVALGGPAGLMQYLMLKEGTFETLAQANAKAVQGMAPKISVWNTGSEGGSGQDAGSAIRNIYSHLPPLMDTIQHQTGITPPNWLMTMPQQQPTTPPQAPVRSNTQEVAPGKKMTNGVPGKFHH